jgi:hypothetical protein
VGLDQHVRELGERDPGLEPALHRFLLEHVAEGEVLARLRRKSSSAGRGASRRCRASGRPGAGEIEEPASWVRMAAALASMASRESIGRSPRLPLGSPTRPVPPPTTTSGRPAEPLEPGQRHHGDQVPDVQRIGGRVEADVAGDRAALEAVGQAGVTSWTRPRSVSSERRSGHGQKVRGGNRGVQGGGKRQRLGNGLRQLVCIPAHAPALPRTVKPSCSASRPCSWHSALPCSWVLWSRACAGGACPSIAGLNEYDPDQASKVYAADGRLLTDFGLQRRTVVLLDSDVPAVVAAFLAVEDKRFYEHHGIDWFRVADRCPGEGPPSPGSGCRGGPPSRCSWPAISGPRASTGGSGSCCGAAGSAEAPRDAGGPRDREALPKDKILELYLNQIELGNRAFGVESAAQRYFGKPVRQVNVAEAAMLAALPKGPTMYNPRRNPRPGGPAAEHWSSASCATPAS